MSWKAIDRYSKDYEALKADGVKFYKTPDAVLKAQLDAWTKIIETKSAENEMFKKVLESQKAFAQRAGKWQGDTLVSMRMAYNHFFAEG